MRMLRSLLLNTPSWKAADIVVRPSTKSVKMPQLNDLVFGHTMTNHMFECAWDSETGWKTPLISEHHNLEISPASSSLHYALQCFEGMKAYRDAAGRVRLFRPEMNFKRMNKSLHRISLPTADEHEMVESLKKLVVLDKDWIPREKGFSLYIRPVCISTHKVLQVAFPKEALFFIIMSPVGPYYKDGFKPVRLLVDTKHVRAWRGGTGGHKVGSNYGPTILPAEEARRQNFDQVLWLNGDTVTEVGSMNFMVVWKNKKGEKELVTAPLSEGTILPGVTRDSALTLARDWGEFKVSEQVFTIQDVIEAHKEGRILEAFGTGTAAIISQVACINYKGVDYSFPCPDNAKTSVGIRLLEEIQAIQYGEKEHEWSVVLS